MARKMVLQKTGPESLNSLALVGLAAEQSVELKYQSRLSGLLQGSGVAVHENIRLNSNNSDPRIVVLRPNFFC